MADTAQQVTVKRFLSSLRLNPEHAAPKPMVQDNLQTVVEEVSEEDRLLSGLAAVLFNIDRADGKFNKGKINDVILQIDKLVNAQLNEVLHHPRFKQMEATWRSLNDLVQNTKFKSNIMIDLLDVSKEELYEDFENNSVDISGSALFRKIYVDEYDQYGGKPYGGMIGLFEFEHNPRDLFWLRQMGRHAAAAHAPFIASVSPRFFGCETIEEVANIKDLEGMMNQPKYSAWNALRDSEEAAYLGLTIPRYMLRLPYHPDTNPAGNLNFTEELEPGKNDSYLWGSSAILFARNMVRSFAESGWCQYIRGPKGGGLITGLPVHAFNVRGEEEIQLPVEIAIPDYRELEFANCGFVPLVYRKGSGDACFFSVQSVKRPKKFKDPKDSENAQLACNLSYTFSVSRIAHYVKCIMRDNIGSTADAAYIQNQLSRWVGQYVTKVANPDDLTLRYYPFKKAEVHVEEQPGAAGWYKCQIAVLPHIQFEGMDVELRLESRL
ncbi:MAG: intracellular growth locus iglB [Planctomycetota bacterium]|nr:MAG: intracellular growth locus iglB [Planctomycetota bacterium]